MSGTEKPLYEVPALLMSQARRSYSVAATGKRLAASSSGLKGGVLVQQYREGPSCFQFCFHCCFFFFVIDGRSPRDCSTHFLTQGEEEEDEE